MSSIFRPAASYTQRHGIFVALTGGTNSGKSVSALRLARGLAGPKGRIAAADTEGGRLLHLRSQYEFDVTMVDPPHRPDKYAEIAKQAEQDGFDALVIDSFSMEWAGVGGVLDWQAAELDRMAGDDWKKRERVKMASWIKPKMAHKAMVYSFLQRRIPIIFAIRGEDSIKPGEPGEKPQKIFREVCNSQFKFEVTVSFRLATDRKGFIDLSDPSSYKMEGSHRDIFKDGEQLSERHGELLAQWAAGAPLPEAGRQPAQDQRQASGQQSLLGDDDPAAQMRRQTQAEAKRIIAKIGEAADDLDLDMLMQAENAALAKVKEASQAAYEHVMTKATERRTTIAQKPKAA